MGRIYQQTHGITLKVQANLTPDISIQFYGSPFTSIGRFDQFKLATNTLSRTYEERFHLFDEVSGEITLSDDKRSYNISHNGENYSFRNPDFSRNEFRSNLVARWEYRPGSTLYFVWEHAKASRDGHHRPNWGDNLDHMFGLPATNIFMIKLNYWFSL